VFRDSTYPSSWINDSLGYPDKIASFFSNNAVKLVDADELKQFMVSSLEEGSSHQKLVVFSQDIVPKTIAENYYTTTTVREYLDAGGSLLWIGDIPLFYIGDEKKVDKAWQKGTPVNMLGIHPVFANPKRTVTFTKCGRNIGMKHKWSGTRPIFLDQGIQALAKSENFTCRYYYVDIEMRKGILRRFWDWVRTAKSISAGGFALEVSDREEVEKKVEKLRPHFHETHVNAWIKCFNKNHPYCGFYRIWDYEVRNLTSAMVEELFNIAQSISRRIARIGKLF